jgi:primosomal protein N' (replication factor Y) (superfamily II helicase)
MASSRFVQVAVPVPLDGLFTYSVPEEIEDIPFGVRVIVPFGRRTVTGVVVAFGTDGTPPDRIKEISRVLDGESLFDEEYLKLAHWVSRSYVSPLGEVLASMLPGARRKKELPDVTGDEPAVEPDRITLSEEQEGALALVKGDLQPGEEGWYYLYGITGSGKTEVFLRLAERTLAAGKSVLYLVPEISLTHQLFDHLVRRFRNRVAMLHSGLTPSQRFGEWHRILNGDASFVVGARSAVFAPVKNLGLVVIDEEHEGSYKSGTSPRYHARQVALQRARQAGAACIMGSATPSVEAWHLMARGRLQRIDLTRRLSGGSLPTIRVENVRGAGSLLSPPLRDALLRTKAMGAQSILFLNRRGYAGVFQCRSCGYQTECPRCSVPMTYHKGQGRMVCHYCGYHTRPMSHCPQCGSLDVGYTGFGTERIEEDLQRELPEMRMARLDTDVTSTRGALGTILKQFGDGELDLLVGTQMVAKGLNFPGVKTVGIVMADTGLSLPDFRAAERTFALIVQVAGRAGRFRRDGEVIVQTMRPEHPAIQRAVQMDVEGFYREELKVREMLRFPPFARLLRLVIRSPRKDVAEEGADRIATALRDHLGSLPVGDAGGLSADILGPAPAPLERINRNWRFQIILRGDSVADLVRLVEAVQPQWGRSRGFYVEIDVDPVQLL